jgi:hypothetical protein
MVLLVDRCSLCGLCVPCMCYVFLVSVPNIAFWLTEMCPLRVLLIYIYYTYIFLIYIYIYIYIYI